MMEYALIIATLAVSSAGLLALNKFRELRARAEQAERQRDVYKKWWDELTVQWKHDRQALSDALDSVARQADALEARRARDPERGTNGRFAKKVD